MFHSTCCQHLHLLIRKLVAPSSMYIQRKALRDWYNDDFIEKITLHEEKKKKNDDVELLRLLRLHEKRLLNRRQRGQKQQSLDAWLTEAKDDEPFCGFSTFSYSQVSRYIDLWMTSALVSLVLYVLVQYNTLADAFNLTIYCKLRSRTVQNTSSHDIFTNLKSRAK